MCGSSRIKDTDAAAHLARTIVAASSVRRLVTALLTAGSENSALYQLGSEHDGHNYGAEVAYLEMRSMMK